MSPLRPVVVRCRPLLRAAAVGGGAYLAGRATARQAAERAARETGQDERIADLEWARQEAAQPAPAPGAARSSLLDQLSELTAMHERGALTDGEFAAAKARILRLPQPSPTDKEPR